MAKFYIKYPDDLVYTECEPLNLNRVVIRKQKEQNNVFMRETFQGDIMFTGEHFLNIAAIDQSLDNCVEILVRLEFGVVTWDGYFTPKMGKFDYDRGTFEVTPATTDIYEPFLKGAEINIIDRPAITVNTAISGYPSYTRTRDMMDVVRTIITEISDITVVSAFFENEVNYVSGLTNVYRYLTIAQKSDVKRPTASEPVRVAMMSFKEIMEIFRKVFNVYWDIKEGILRIEHLSLFEFEGEEINIKSLNGTKSTNKYYYDNDNMPSSEYLKMDALIEPFVGMPIVYNSLCARGDASEDSTNVVTDIKGIVNGMETADSGWVIFANDDTGSPRDLIIGATPLSAMTEPNSPMALAFLMNMLWKNGRVLPEGMMNGVETEFETSKRVILQNLSLAECIEIPSDARLITSLTDILTYVGLPISIDYKVSGGIDMVLSYGKETELPPIDPSKIIYVHISTSVRPVGVCAYETDLYINITTSQTPDSPLSIDVKVDYEMTDSEFTGSECVNYAESDMVFDDDNIDLISGSATRSSLNNAGQPTTYTPFYLHAISSDPDWIVSVSFT